MRSLSNGVMRAKICAVCTALRRCLSDRPFSVSAVRTSPAANPAFNPRFKTRMCRWWQREGSCPHGLRCAYAHGEEELKAMRARAEGAGPLALALALGAAGVALGR
jgi:hypothetical protein